MALRTGRFIPLDGATNNMPLKKRKLRKTNDGVMLEPKKAPANAGTPLAQKKKKVRPIIT